MPRIPAKLLMLGGAAVASAAGALLKRDKVAGVIGSRSRTPEPPAPEPAREHDPHPVGPSNYDAAGPPANTATPVPAPEPIVHPAAIDEEAEEAAAAAEAAAIGGGVPRYQDLTDPTLTADEAARPLMESGEGWEEGEELAEEDLIDAASPSDTKSPYERRLEDAIEAQDDPNRAERGEALQTGAAYAETGNPEADTAGTAPAPPRQEPGPDASAPREQAPADRSDEDGPDDERQTWSGQAVKP